MNENVTVEEALSKGFWLLKFPVYIFIIVPIIFQVCFHVLIFGKPIDTYFILFMSLLMYILYRCYVVTYWKIWAYTNVRNVNELKRKALKKS